MRHQDGYTISRQTVGSGLHINQSIEIFLEVSDDASSNVHTVNSNVGTGHLPDPCPVDEELNFCNGQNTSSELQNISQANQVMIVDNVQQTRHNATVLCNENMSDLAINGCNTDGIDSGNKIIVEDTPPLDSTNQPSNLLYEKISTLGEGHCLFHAIVNSLAAQHDIILNSSDVLSACVQEFEDCLSVYQSFTQESEGYLRALAQEYIENKQYNNLFCDLAPYMISNRMKISIRIHN